jgi:HK97 family phage major capsid protein
MTIQEMMDNSLKAYKAGQAIIEEADKKAGGVGKGKLTAEELAQANGFMDEGEQWKLRADNAHRQEQFARELKALTEPQRHHPMGVDDQETAKRVAEFASLGLGNLPGVAQSALKLEDVRFKKFGFESVIGPSPIERKAAFEAFMRFGAHRLEDAEKKALTPLTDTEGGYVLTQEYRTEVIRKLRNLVYILGLATVIDTQAAGVAVPTFDPADTQTTVPVTLPNGQIVQWSLSNVFGKTSFTPHARKVIIPIPLELLEDAVIDVSSLFTDWASLRMSEIMEQDFISGTGVNQPLGLVTTPGLPTLAIAGATTLMVPEDIVKTVYGMRAVYRRDASFLMHRLVVQALRLFRTNIGGAGTGTFMFQPSLQAGEPPTLFGYRLLESEFMPNPSTGAAGTWMMLFANLKFYWIVRRIDMMVTRLNERYADLDQVGFRIRSRYDAAPILADPFLALTRN